MKSKLVYIILTLLIPLSDARAQPADVIDAIAGNFRTSNASKVADHFSSTLELNILSEENLYSKAQAEQIIRDFLSKNKPVAVKIIHRLSSNPNYKLAVLSLVTGKDVYRISMSLSSNGERFLIKEIRIEYDKQ